MSNIDSILTTIKQLETERARYDEAIQTLRALVLGGSSSTSLTSLPSSPLQAVQPVSLLQPDKRRGRPPRVQGSGSGEAQPEVRADGKTMPKWSEESREKARARMKAYWEARRKGANKSSSGKATAVKSKGASKGARASKRA